MIRLFNIRLFILLLFSRKLKHHCFIFEKYFSIYTATKLIFIFITTPDSGCIILETTSGI